MMLREPSLGADDDECAALDAHIAAIKAPPMTSQLLSQYLYRSDPRLWLVPPQYPRRWT
jgi:hypothetical protein